MVPGDRRWPDRRKRPPVPTGLDGVFGLVKVLIFCRRSWLLWRIGFSFDVCTIEIVHLFVDLWAGCGCGEEQAIDILILP